MYFVLGMLSIIAAAFVAVIVWGLLKINRQQQRIDYIQRLIDEAPRELHTRFVDMDRELNDRINWNHRHIDDIDDKINRRISECDAYLHRRIDETNSYIDSRIDKALSTISTKQLIKG